MVTGERTNEVQALLARTREWSSRRPDVVAAGLVGSRACGDARMDSDVDLVLLTTAKQDYLENESWVRELGGLRIIKTEQWGPEMTERRFILPSGLEVEAGIAPPSWAATDPVDPNLKPILREGFRILYDPEGLLGRLLEACD
ncbi:MAG: nucleotidyltransferase domain-containing protein [Rubrobacteraceae bacterium]